MPPTPLTHCFITEASLPKEPPRDPPYQRDVGAKRTVEQGPTEVEPLAYAVNVIRFVVLENTII
jgi:hypothetical protein